MDVANFLSVDRDKLSGRERVMSTSDYKRGSYWSENQPERNNKKGVVIE